MKQLFWFENKNFFASKKVTNQLKFNKKVASNEKICKRKTGLISQTNVVYLTNKVVYLTADPNMGPFKADFHLYIERYIM